MYWGSLVKVWFGFGHRDAAVTASHEIGHGRQLLTALL